jgi:uncharacterized membrane protein
MPAWTIIVPSFLTASVEWVEAFTIVLAASLTIGWRAAGGAALCAFVVLAAMTSATGGALSAGLDIAWLQGAIGIFLLLFGVRWLAKAIARQSGLKKQRDEAVEFEHTSARLATADWYAGWTIAFKGVLLEGIEVWLIVVAFGTHGGWTGSLTGAIAALIVVVAAGLAIRPPLTRVPENAIKFAVGAMVVSFGTFWTLEALGGPGIWPMSDWSLPGLAIFYAVGGMLLTRMLRRPCKERLSHERVHQNPGRRCLESVDRRRRGDCHIWADQRRRKRDHPVCGPSADSGRDRLARAALSARRARVGQSASDFRGRRDRRTLRVRPTIHHSRTGA